MSIFPTDSFRSNQHVGQGFQTGFTNCAHMMTSSCKLRELLCSAAIYSTVMTWNNENMAAKSLFGPLPFPSYNLVFTALK